MAQAEDTELRDLVIDALEKNGSLAKIRALLRANIFLAFEDESENYKQNDTLDRILQIPEGNYCLSIIHDFLEFCNLRNTLFVYKSETRQGKEYKYDSLNAIADKLNVTKFNREKEPMLLTLLKAALKSDLKINCKKNDKYINVRSQSKDKTSNKDEQNSTYIVNEDSSTNTSQTQSDNSSDEKNKLDLRLTLDNSDTESSSDSTRGRTSSEYIPNNHIATKDIKINNNQNDKLEQSFQPKSQNSYNYVMKEKRVSEDCLHDIQVINNSSTESTSYIELKPFNSIDTVLLNTPGVPFDEGKCDIKSVKSPQNSNSTVSKIESSVSINDTISESKKDSHQDSKVSPKGSGKSEKYDIDATEYSYDFMSPPVSGRKDASDKLSPRLSLQDFIANKSNISVENIQNSSSSQSSISLSDVADLISDKSSKKSTYVSNKQKLLREKLNKSGRDYSNKLSDDSGDFSESPIPSLSNLSLDIHSD